MFLMNKVLSKSEAKVMFQMFDKNGNGLLDTKEIKQAFKLMGNDLSDEEFEKLV